MIPSLPLRVLTRPAPRSRVSLNDKPVARYNQGRSNKSLDASGRSASRNLLGPAEGVLIRAAASTPPFARFACTRVRTPTVRKSLVAKVALANARASDTNAARLALRQTCSLPKTPRSRVSLNDKPGARYNQGRSNTSLDASGIT